MTSFFRTFTRDDRETEVVAEIDVSTWGEPASYDHPGCGPECEIVGAWLSSDENRADAPHVSLTDAERERMESEFLEDPPEPDYGDDD